MEKFLSLYHKYATETHYLYQVPTTFCSISEEKLFKMLIKN